MTLTTTLAGVFTGVLVSGGTALGLVADDDPVVEDVVLARHLREGLRAALFYLLVYAFMTIGSFAIGAFAKVVNVQVAIASSAAVMLLYAGWTFYRHPDLRSV